MVSNARLLFPEPLRPVITVRLSRGISTSMPLRLCSRAPRTEMWVSIGLSFQLCSYCSVTPLGVNAALPMWVREAAIARESARSSERIAGDFLIMRAVAGEVAFEQGEG